MKLKALFLALAVAGVAASFGLTDTGRSDTGTNGATTTGTTTTTTSNGDCGRFELKGTLASVSATSFTVNVTRGNKAVKDAAGTAVTVAVTPDTRVSWSGRGTLTGPNAGDRVEASGKQCGTALSASRVEARAPRQENAQEAKSGDNGSHSGDKGGKKDK